MPAAAATRSPPGWARLLLKLGVTGAALGWAMSRTSFSAMTGAVRSLSLRAILISVALLLANVGVGALRWRAVIGAYPGARTPRLGFLAHGYLVASFYNTFVPGNIGGDALRAHAARSAFEHPADAFATIAIERGMGLGALLVLSGIGTSFLEAAPGWLGPSLAVTGAVLATVAGASPWLSVRLMKFLPARLRSKMPALSVPTGVPALGLAFLWSIVSQ
ncbi:MAG TPA: lysylphosphatidylglycerol synthase transmembrane domain-containing protein, partial [Polyangiaceae bacterium]